MSAETAVPAAVRIPRPAAGRRALLTLLFFGGLFALAFFFGGSAHAATGPELPDGDGQAAPSAKLASGDRTGPLGERPGKLGAQSKERAHKASSAARHSATRTAGTAHDTTTSTGTGGASALTGDSGAAQRTADAGDRLAQQRRLAREAAGRVTSEVTQPVRDGAERTRQATRPVGDTVHRVTEHTGAGLHRVTSGLLPGGLLPQHGTAPGADRAAAHQDGESGDRADHADHHSGTKSQAPQAASYAGPHTLPDGAATQHATAGDGSFGDGSGHGLPGPRPPQHELPSVPATSSAQYHAGDGSGTRGGPDQLAAYVTDMERFGPLLPGAVHTAQDGPVRERAGDILEFPG